MTTPTKTTSVLRELPGNLVDGRFLPIEGDGLVSTNPARPDEVLWSGSPTEEHVDLAVHAARQALEEWSQRSREQRAEVLRRWQDVVRRHADRLAELITDEMGKVLSESKAEVGAVTGKVDITLDDVSLDRVREYEVAVSDSRIGRCRYKPHGVMAVVGPFNFPAHLANGHFVPAMLLGNTVVFKPSEKTPAVGQLIGEMMVEADVPPGVFNVVQGGADVSRRLTTHEEIDGIAFTGSWPVGRKILEANLDRPGRIVALEMGGNNPAVVMDDADLRQAVIECLRAGFGTTGQRCTCTRRVIVHEAIAEQFISAFCKAASTIVIGPGRSPEPVFMGPIVSKQAADDVLAAQADLVRRGGRVLVEAARPDEPGHYISPGVAEVDGFSIEQDGETFGPLVQICTVSNLDEAIEQANQTNYGLAASIFTADQANFDRFFHGIRSGCINWNAGTAGASSKLPFGGVGLSGNHRPAGAFSVEYCAYPIANMVERSTQSTPPDGLQLPDTI